MDEPPQLSFSSTGVVRPKSSSFGSTFPSPQTTYPSTKFSAGVEIDVRIERFVSRAATATGAGGPSRRSGADRQDHALGRYPSHRVRATIDDDPEVRGIHREAIRIVEKG